MMKLLTLLSTALITATQAGDALNALEQPYASSSHRQLSGDAITYDDDFWAYNLDADVNAQTIWTDYNFVATKCIV